MAMRMNRSMMRKKMRRRMMLVCSKTQMLLLPPIISNSPRYLLQHRKSKWNKEGNKLSKVKLKEN